MVTHFRGIDADYITDGIVEMTPLGAIELALKIRDELRAEIKSLRAYVTSLKTPVDPNWSA